MAEQELELSLDPETFVEGGGLIDDVDAVVKSANYEMWTYPNTSMTIPSLKLVLSDDDGVDHIQNYSCGDAKNFAPSGDGTRLIPIGKATGVSKDSNLAMLMTSLIQAGFPKTALKGSDCTVFIGLKAHWLRKAVPKKKPSDKDRSVLCVTDVISLPGEKAAKKGAVKAATTTTAAAAPVDSDTEQAATDLILEVLKTDGAINKKILLSKVTKIAAERRLAVKKIVPIITDEFLGADTASWDYDVESGTVKPFDVS